MSDTVTNRAPAGSSQATAKLFERAPAKVNLSLRVLGRRTDGYHDLSSLVAFTGAADRLALTLGAPLGLEVAGNVAALGDEADNLVLKATRALQALVPGLITGHFHLTKKLPIAAGLGGGSADAGFWLMVDLCVSTGSDLKA